MRVFLILLMCSISIFKAESQMIKIQFEEEKPKYFGSSGLHLYALSSDFDFEKEVLVDAKVDAITLYKLYFDLSIFLSNEINPKGTTNEIELIGVFGSSKYKDQINSRYNSEIGYQLVGFLGKQDVKKVSAFLKKNQLNTKEGITAFYHNLSDDVRDNSILAKESG